MMSSSSPALSGTTRGLNLDVSSACVLCEGLFIKADHKQDGAVIKEQHTRITVTERTRHRVSQTPPNGHLDAPQDASGMWTTHTHTHTHAHTHSHTSYTHTTSLSLSLTHTFTHSHT